MELLGVDEKTAKGSGSQISAIAIRSGIDWKLHCLARPMHSRMSTLVEKPRDIEVKVGGQRPVDAEVGGPRSRGLNLGGLRLGSQKDQVRNPNQEVLDRGSGLELEDK